MKKNSLFWLVFPVLAATGLFSAGVAVLGASQPELERFKGWAWIGLIGIIPAAVSALGAWWISSRLKKDENAIAAGTARFALGRLDAKIPPGDAGHLLAVADSLNRMAEELDGKIGALTSEKQNLEAILTCVMDGVMAIGPEMEILNINPKAREILDIKTGRDEGLYLGEVCPEHEILRAVEAGLKNPENAGEEIVIENQRGKTIQAVISPLYGVNGETGGLVMALADITRLKRLENLRSDFAANVSHELRTPITSIKGFVENLKSDAMEDPKAARKFLEIIERQTNRLGAIIEDLLSLANLEKESETDSITFERTQALVPIQNAAASLSEKAKGKGVNVEIDCPDDLTSRMNAALIEQAVFNLLDNAVNYSPDGGRITVIANESGGRLSIIVRDEGIGIDKSHLDRLFERFYRADPARSRKLGGTGLGLSIVKHIALAHGGHATVNSAPGEGSAFSIHMPAEDK